MVKAVRVLTASFMVAAIFLFMVPAPVSADSGTYYITQSSDDVTRRLNTSTWTMTAEVQCGGLAASYQQYGAGLRWQSLAIPAGSTITTAYITFNAQRDCTGTATRSRICGELDSNPSTFADNSGVFDTRYANHTTAVIDWDNLPAWYTDTTYQSPEIKTVIQEIIDLPGWSAGNSLVLFWQDFDNRSTLTSDNRKFADSYDSDNTKTPALYIEWTPPGPPDCPDNLTATKTNLQQIVLSWDAATTTDYYTVRGSYVGVPGDNESGYLVYTGPEISCTVNGVGPELRNVYFSLWNISSGNCSTCLEYVIVGGEPVDVSIDIPLNIWVFAAAMLMLLAAVFFQKLLLYLALIPLWMGVIATAGNVYIDSAAGIVLLFAILGIRHVARKQASGGV